MAEITSATGCYRVKREGGKGWHWVAPDHYDPKVHVLVDPLDHDADGRKGGSLPDHVHEPADYEIDEKPKRKPRRKAAK